MKWLLLLVVALSGCNATATMFVEHQATPSTYARAEVSVSRGAVLRSYR